MLRDGKGDDNIFQSTLPVGGATQIGDGDCNTEGISIHAPRGGSDEATARLYDIESISIHAPRGGSDAKLDTI